MNIKIIFEIEEGSRKVIENFSQAILKLGNTEMIKNTVESMIESTTEQIQDIEPKKSIEVGDWTTNDYRVEVIESKEDEKVEVPKSTLPTYSDVDLTGYCAEGSRLGLGSKIKDLIREKFKVMKVSEIAQDKRGEFVNDLRELGVRV